MLQVLGVNRPVRIAWWTALAAAGFVAGLSTRPAPPGHAATHAVRPPPPVVEPEREPRPVAAPSARRLVAARATEPPVADPIELSDLGVAPPEIFDAEPRDPDWAPGAEASARLEEYRAAMMPYLERSDVECRHSACRVMVEVPPDRETEAFSLIQAFPLGDVRLAPMIDRDAHVITLLVFYRPHVRPLTAMLGAWDAQKAQRFPDGFAQARAWVDANPIERREP